MKVTQEKVKEEVKPESPLIHRPERKEHYIPVGRYRIESGKETTKNDQSFNASTIISSLVQANKTKLASGNVLANKLAQKPEKFEEFRSFPNKQNSSIYDAPPPRSESKEESAVVTEA